MALMDMLIAVALVDARRLALKTKLVAAPAGARAEEAKAEAARSTVGKQRDESKRAGLELKRLEGEVKAKQQDVEKTQTQQNQARANDGFQAHGKRILALKAEIGDLEMKILEEFERADRRESDRAPLDKKVKELEAESKAARARADAAASALRAELEAADAERREKLAGLDPKQLAVYERSLEKHGDRAVVAVQDGYCQGCLVRIRPQQSVQLRGRENIVTCWECDRLLYAE